MNKRNILEGIFGAIIVVGFIALAGLIFMLLWNFVIPSVFGLNTIGYFQGFALVALIIILGELWNLGIGVGNDSNN